jgi:hypothetical protein
MIKLRAIFYVTLLSIGLHASELPQHVRIILDQHTSELRELLYMKNLLRLRGVEKKYWLPGYIIKYDLERFSNAEKLRKVIQKYNLNLLDVPCKYVYQVCDKNKAPSNLNSIVIAEKIEGKSGLTATLNLQQTQQLYCAALHAPHYDLHSENYIVTPSGKIYIIDTDSVAMPPLYEIGILKVSWLLCGDGLYNDFSMRFKSSLHENKKFHFYNEEAAAWLQTILEQRRSQRNKTRVMMCAILYAGIILSNNLKY